MRVYIDDERCKGHGTCCGACPEVFEMTDHGYAHVLLSEIPAELQEAVSTAVEHCPEGAISIEE
jgi:ferredoxin